MNKKYSIGDKIKIVKEGFHGGHIGEEVWVVTLRKNGLPDIVETNKSYWGWERDKSIPSSYKGHPPSTFWYACCAKDIYEKVVESSTIDNRAPQKIKEMTLDLPSTISIEMLIGDRKYKGLVQAKKNENAYK